MLAPLLALAGQLVVVAVTRQVVVARTRQVVEAVAGHVVEAEAGHVAQARAWHVVEGGVGVDAGKEDGTGVLQANRLPNAGTQSKGPK